MDLNWSTESQFALCLGLSQFAKSHFRYNSSYVIQLLLIIWPAWNILIILEKGDGKLIEVEKHIHSTGEIREERNISFYAVILWASNFNKTDAL